MTQATFTKRLRALAAYLEQRGLDSNPNVKGALDKTTGRCCATRRRR
jgi:hypothetical protein